MPVVSEFRSRLIPLLSAAALLASAGAAHAQTQKGLLLAEPQTLSSMVRTGGPIPLIWKITNEGAGLLEGSLEVVITDGSTVLGRVLVTDLVLTTGETAFNTMLPTVAANNQFNTLELRVRFIHEEGRIDLGTHTLRAPGPWQRSLVACICTPQVYMPTAGQTALTEAIRLERFHPESDDKRLVTSRSTVLPDEMPDDPLFYCGFDFVLLTPEGFAELDEKQLNALQAWVAAGGSLLAYAGRTLAPEHALFLNHLFGTEPDRPPFMLDDSGRLVDLDADESAGWTSGAGIRTAQFGLGRAALEIAPTLDAIDVDNAQWRRMLSFLWKTRHEQVRPAVHDGTWDFDLVKTALKHVQADQSQYYEPPDEQEFETLLFSQETIYSGDQLMRYLMPDSVRVVPWWLIALVLLAYVAVIGPGDYFVLGLFRRRKLTWLLFPVVTLAFTLFAIWLSHHYMQTTDLFKSVVIRDVGAGGSIVRQSQFELVFSGTRRDVATQVRRGMFSPLNHLEFGSTYYYRGQYNPQDDALVGATTYAGRVPYLYAALQDVPQWTPQLNRVFSIAPEVEPPPFDWDEFDVAPSEIWNRRMPLAVQLKQAFGPDVSAWVYHGQRSERIIGNRDLLSEDQFVYTPYHRQIKTNFLQETSVRSGRGMYAVVSHLAPTGGPNFEDLPLLDSSDESQWLLVVAVPSGSDLLVYRKLYTARQGKTLTEASHVDDSRETSLDRGVLRSDAAVSEERTSD